MYRQVILSGLLTQLVEAAELFHHRLNHASVVAGPYLYIDGGEISLWNGTGDGTLGSDQCSRYDGAGCPGNITVNADNNTYAIDLSTSWSNETVVLNSITKIAPVLKRECLWVDDYGSTIYSYGGDNGGPGGKVPVPENALWQFTPRGSHGSWSTVPLDPKAQNFTSLSRTVSGGCASGESLGFSLGGVNSDDRSQLSPGMVVHNTTSHQWYNVSAFGLDSGTYYLGATHFAQPFGPEGLLIVMAGAAPRDGFGDKVLLDTDSVMIYEPVSQKWKTQVVTGSPPLSCVEPCVAGARGDRGTYEIFFYGGADSTSRDNTMALGSVHVLSLPAFNWQKTDYDPKFGRWGHSCSVSGRQMITVGGSVLTQDSINYDETSPGSAVDPFSNGIGVFDMTTMLWRDSYDAAAGEYETPQRVKQYYDSYGIYPSSFGDDLELRSWFVKDTSNTSPSSTPRSENHDSDTGAIAGGVVGSVLGLALIAVAIWWFVRRKSKPKRSSSEYHKAELENTSHGFQARTQATEIHSHSLQEMESSQLHGLDSTRLRELDSPRLHEMEGSRPSKDRR